MSDIKPLTITPERDQPSVRQPVPPEPRTFIVEQATSNGIKAEDRAELGWRLLQTARAQGEAAMEQRVIDDLARDGLKVMPRR
jgi:hypothetical protein